MSATNERLRAWMRRSEVMEKVGATVFEYDNKPHILVDYTKCATCVDKPCIPMCPPSCYTLEEGKKLVFNSEGCFECGTCRVVCPAGGNGAVSWHYPNGGRGVRFREG
ncbi:MAG TPA: ferredoxin family protein [Candidatus Thermoplasmatota archaeon]|nr:ferredoxin family protein [Candidatus Thermoplasmatota archaeon]